MAGNTTFLKSLSAAADNNIAASQSPGAGAISLNGTAVSNGVATIDALSSTNTALGRRVIVTSGGDDSSITFTVTGTNAAGMTISDSFAGAAVGVAQSNLDFVTVTSVTHTGSVAGTVKVGTNGVGSSTWLTMNWMGQSPMNVGALVELVSGSVNFSLQQSYDDPNNLPSGLLYPTPVTPTAWSGKSATLDGAFTTPFIALRVLINSGTGVIRVRYVQAGIG